MNKMHEQLIVLIGILLVLVLIVQGISFPEKIVLQESADKVVFTPEKQIRSNAITAAYILPDIKNSAKVSVEILEK